VKAEEIILTFADTDLDEWNTISEQLRTQVTSALPDLQHISDLLAAHFNPVLEIQEKLWRSIEPIIEAQKPFRDALEVTLGTANPFAQICESFTIPPFEFPGIADLTRQIAELRDSLRSPAFEQFHPNLRELPIRTRDALLILGMHGWYLDFKMPLSKLWKFQKAFSKGNAEDAEKALADYFEGRLNEIEISISERFPHRAHFVRAAFDAHRRKEYVLSIPVLFAQSDGMCKESVNQYLFVKRGKKPGTAVYVEQVASDTFRAALLSPLAQTLPISASEGQTPRSSNALNRHTVLHGVSLDYGNRINSLKAISLLNYLAQVLENESDASADASGSDYLSGGN
jgi:hypothetical protein